MSHSSSIVEKLKLNDLSVQILLGLALGVFTGLFFGEQTQVIEWIGEVWIRLMQMAVIPYVTISLISGVGSLNASLAKLLAIRGTLLMLLFWAISAVILVAMPLAFPTWVDASFLSHSNLQQAEAFNPIELYVPENPFHSLANSIVPAIVLFSIVLGVALIHLKDKDKLLDGMTVLTEALIKIMKFMIRLTPVGVFSIVAVAAGSLTLEELAQLEVFFITYAVASLLLTFAIIPMIISMFTAFSYFEIIRYSRSAILTGFVTQNILVTLPLLICKSVELFEKHNMDSEKNRHVVDVVLPVTFNFPLTGRLLALLFIPFTAWMSGSGLPLSDYPQLIATGIFSLFAKAQVALSFLMDLFRIPHDLFYLYIPGSIINGKFDTMVSVMNLFAFSLIITVSITGQMKIYWKKILRLSVLIAVLLIVTVFLTKLFLAEFTLQTYDKDQDLMSLDTAFDKNHDFEVKQRLPEMPRSLSGDLLSEIKSSGVLRVGYRSERVPLSFVNSKGQLVGLDVDFFNLLADELGVRVEFYHYEWEDFFRLLNEGYLDIVPAVAFDIFNIINVGLSEPYLPGRLSFVTKDYNRHAFMEIESLEKLETVRLAILGEPMFVQKMTQRLERFLPDVELQIIPISSYQEFFELGDSVDALVEVAEIGAGLTLLHPEYSVVSPKNSLMNFPMSYAVSRTEEKFAKLLSKWISIKKSHGELDMLKEYWIYGGGARAGKRRWSIKENVLGW